MHVRRLGSVVEMATVLEECIAEAALRCAFLWARGLYANNIHKEIFPAYCWNCLLRKVAHSWVQTRDKYFADEEEFETEVRKWLRQQSKDVYAAGFDELVKRWGRCINVGGGYFEK
jgi:hypothetical protein